MKNVSSSNSQGELVPKLRFPGFEREWQQRTFSDLFSFLGNNTLSRADLSDSGEVKNIHYGDVLIKFDDTIEANDPRIPYITSPESLKKNIDLLQTGDVIIADTAEDDTVGKATELLNPANIPVVSGLHTIPVRPNDEFYPSYLGYYINSKSYHSQLYPLMQGIKVTSISKGNIGKTLVRYPSHAEQQKIASVLNLLTQRIAKQRQLIDTLKSYKRGAMSVMFPKAGKAVPKHRFASYTGDWSKCKLGSLAIFNPRSDLPEIFEYVDLESVSGTEMISHRTMSRDTAPSRAQRLARTGDLFFQTVRPYQRNNYLFEKTECNYVFSTGYAQMRPLINGPFLFCLIQNDAFVKTVLDKCTGTGYPAINSNDLAGIEVYSPADLREQEQIGNFFKRLDNVIVLQQQKYDFLLSIKRSLLQQLFI